MRRFGVPGSRMGKGLLWVMMCASVIGLAACGSGPGATVSLTPSPDEQRAASFTGSNADWAPVATVFPDDPAGAEMVLVPVGRFSMGGEGQFEGPVHAQAFTAPFWIDRTEVTRGQYALCVAAGACAEPVANDFSQRDTQPVNRVTWLQARDYCAWRGLRLPTEAEWEYAARGPAGWVYPWGDEWAEERAVYFRNSGDVTADVGRFPAGASWVGALDMSGNVWEWTSSLWADYPYDATHENASDEGQARVMRGGAFDGGTGLQRAAYREMHSPDFESYAIGFRCARP